MLVGKHGRLYLWVFQSCFIVHFWHIGHDWHPVYCSHLTLITVHYSVNNHHVVISVLEEASLKTGNKSVLKTKCVIIQHIWWKESKPMISVMALLNRNYIRQTTVSRGNAVVEKSISCAPFFRLFSPHIFPRTLWNVCKKCWFSLFLWTNSWHLPMLIKTNISKHFTEEQTSLPTSGREIQCCHL